MKEDSIETKEFILGLKRGFRNNVMSGVGDVYYSRLGSPRTPGGVLEMVHRTFWLKQRDQIKKQT